MLRYIVHSVPLLTRGYSNRYYISRSSSDDFASVCDFYFHDWSPVYKNSEDKHFIPSDALDTSFVRLDLADVHALIWRAYKIMISHQDELSLDGDMYDSVFFATFVSQGTSPADKGMYLVKKRVSYCFLTLFYVVLFSRPSYGGRN
jgi:hypothetical protein